MSTTTSPAATSAPASKPLIRIDGVRRTFGPLVALEKVDLTIERGEMVAFIGPSGCGKTTLLNIVGGLIEASEGTAWVDDVAVKGPSPKKISYVFQESALLPWATVLDNIEVGLEFQGVPAKDRHARATAALAAVGMTRFAASYPQQLSGGMKQRVALARSLSLETDILLMDEPFAALDEQTRMVFGEDLSQLLASHAKTIILVTHSLAESVFLSDRIVVFTARPGRIKAVLTVDEPHPRKAAFMTSEKLGRIRNELYELLRGEVINAMGEDSVGGGGATGT